MNAPRISLSLDTSVVLRLITHQPTHLYDCAASFVEEQLIARATVFVSDQVLAETYFALQTFYKMTKSDALLSLSEITRATGLSLSPTAREVLSIPNLATAKPGFVDRLIHGSARAAGHTLITFEKAARKLPGTIVLPVS